MDADEKRIYIIAGLATLVMIVFIFIIATFGATFEARTFNKFSSQKANIWDAFFADLRIEACRQNF